MATKIVSVTPADITRLVIDETRLQIRDVCEALHVNSHTHVEFTTWRHIYIYILVYIYIYIHVFIYTHVIV